MNVKGKKRVIGLDLLKIVAAIFVVLLHIGGYTYGNQVNGIATFDISYHLIEALAYPAIHLFVMCGAIFLQKRSTINKKAVLNICLQTWIVCIIGLMISVIAGLPVPIYGIFQSFFPITFRAYWFVTDYLLLIIVSPLLNKVINNISPKELFIYTVVILVVNTIFCFFLSTFGWNQEYSNVGLFICLYFIVATLRVYRDGKLLLNKKKGLILWSIGFALLVLSWIVIRVILKETDREMFFYSYNCPLVLCEAIGIFIIFYSMNIENKMAISIITFLSEGSLVSYLIHMHPIIKLTYSSDTSFLHLFDNMSNITFAGLSLIGGIVLFIGALINIPMKVVVTYLSNRIMHT